MNAHKLGIVFCLLTFITTTPARSIAALFAGGPGNAVTEIDTFTASIANFFISPNWLRVTGIAYNPLSKTFFIGDDGGFITEYDPRTKMVVNSFTTPGGGDVTRLAISPTYSVYVGEVGGLISEIDPATGSIGNVFNTVYGNEIGGLTFSPAGTLYIGETGGPMPIYEYDPLTASIGTFYTDTPNGSAVAGLAFTSGGALYIGEEGGFITEIDPFTGSIGNNFKLGYEYEGLTEAPSLVPLPPTVLLMVSGLGLMGLFRRTV